MIVTILKEFENSALATIYPIRAGKTYDTDKANCPINAEQMTILLMMRMATDNDDISQWKNVVWEEKRYKKDSAVIKDNCVYVANQKTSKTWVDEEWDIVLQGV